MPDRLRTSGMSANTLSNGRGCGSIRDHLSEGFWHMRGVPGKQDSMRNKTLWLFLAPVGNPYPKTR